MSAVTVIVQCPRDPGVETALRCQQCDTPICPRCLVQSPVGAKCKDCARVVKSPIYTLSGIYIVRAAIAAIVGGVAMGIVWGLVSSQLAGGLGFVSFFAGAGLGYAFTRLLEFATNRKRGPAVIAFAMGGIAIAFGIQFVMAGQLLTLGSLIAVGVGLYFSYQNLR